MPPAKKTKKEEAGSKKDEEAKMEDVAKADDTAKTTEVTKSDNDAAKADENPKAEAAAKADKDDDAKRKNVANDKNDKQPVEKEETDSDDDEEEDDKSNDGDREVGGKRKRKSSLESAFEPVDFTMHGGKDVKIIKGRGKKLKQMPSVVASMEKHSLEDVLFAHKFLFGNRGSTLKKKDLLANLHEFSGYLKEVPKGYDKDKLEAEDEIEETKFSKKAFKLVLAQVKQLCDFFDVLKVSEEGKPLNKDDMIENLLDFLSQPHPDFLSSENQDLSKKKTTPKKKSTSTKTTGTTPTTKALKDPFDLVRNHKRGTMPNNETLRQWVKAYIVSFDMDSATTKHAIRTASEKFGVDMVPKKDTIKMLLAEEM